ncbi:OmpH family outer membrane protein [Litoribrevibacter albus]|uniref:Outer membrane protein n=1 Tax=Litoribrevibacter albus TaxID=1473156 RepID=A0AA37S8T2_9GAMM|nr:OmpH family outer membrane protein [Litoribrevibacter albus]GLQ31170.1 outer membrane protein [Litoribrevibacter albus]
MKKIISALVISVLSLASSVAFAESKIAVVDIYRALMNSEAAKAAVAELQNEFKAEQDQLSQLEQEIRTLQEKGQKDGMLMSDEDKRRLFEEIQSKQSDAKHIIQKVRKMQTNREKEFLAQNKPMIDAALKELVDELKIDLLLTREATLWVSPSMDITLKLLEKLNTKETK